MTVVLDASIAAAWLLPEEDSDAAEALIAGLSGREPVPSLFWHEARNVLIVAERADVSWPARPLPPWEGYAGCRSRMQEQVGRRGLRSCSGA